MVVVLGVVAVVLVFVIAAVFVGGETFRLRRTPEAAVFDLDEAVEAVADGLTPDLASSLTYEEVRTLIIFCLDHLGSKGLSAMPGQEPTAPVDDDVPVVVADDDAVAVVLGRADGAGLDVTDHAVLVVLDLLLDHLAEIGAVGPQAG